MILCLSLPNERPDWAGDGGGKGGEGGEREAGLGKVAPAFARSALEELPPLKISRELDAGVIQERRTSGSGAERDGISVRLALEAEAPKIQKALVFFFSSG